MRSAGSPHERKPSANSLNHLKPRLGILPHLMRERTPTVTVGIASILCQENTVMNNIIWLIGAIVVVLAILSFLGLR
ncbi:hypothetical protein SAMN02927923_04229 [Microvirga guangxiensis]|uniref:Uncharacterized protein n=1 Tax=Microvirga guangxiensis TaxID=549386 RepID=A0A1G5LGL1_9HYPH|nr:hypothetical protein SAMN02927923_04229 [Microvirga guangxiensis]